MQNSSSLPYREQLRPLNEDAKEITGNQKAFLPGVRAEDTPDAERMGTLRRALKSLNTELSPAIESRTEMRDLNLAWMKLRDEKMTGKEREVDNPIYEAFSNETKYLDTIRGLDRYVKKLQREKDAIESEIDELLGPDSTLASMHSPTPGTGPTLAPVIQPIQVAHDDQCVKLKPIEITTFSGDITAYRGFRETFLASVGNRQMPKLTRFLHLKNHLAGSPLNAIAELPPCDDSWDAAWVILNEEFGNEGAIQDALYNALQNLKAPNTSAAELRRYTDSVEQICIKLRGVGEDPEQKFLANIVERKLPYSVLQEIQKCKLRANAAHWSMFDLRKKLKEIVRLKETMDRTMEQVNLERPNKPQVHTTQWGTNRRLQPLREQPQEQLRPSTLTFVAQQQPMGSSNNGNQSRRPIRPCLFCESPHHFSSRCERFATKQERQNRLRELRKCPTCVRSEHPNGQCSLLACSGCQGTDHHRLLCPTEIRAASQNAQQAVKNLSRSGANAVPMGNQGRVSNFAQQQPHVAQHEGGQARQEQRTQTQVRFTPLNQNTPPNTNPQSLVNVANRDTAASSPTRDRSLVFLKCLVVEVFNPQRSHVKKEALVMFDDGSTDSYVTNKLASELQLALDKPRCLTVGTFSTDRVARHLSQMTKLGLRLSSGGSTVIEANAMGYITHPIPFLYSDKASDMDGGLLPFSSVAYRSPDILIGSDFYYDFQPQHVGGFENGLALIRSTLGMMLAGKATLVSNQVFPFQPGIEFPPDQPVRMAMTAITTGTAAYGPVDELNTMVAEHFSLESIGIEKPAESSTNEEVAANFKRTIKYSEAELRYYVHLPFKQPHPELSPNFYNTWRQLKTVHKRLVAQGLLKKYDAVIKDQVQRGFVEIVPEPKQHGTPLFYLPHHAVVREDKPDKPPRIVNNASSKPYRDGLSLNDILHAGPNLLNDLTGVCMRFRLYAIVVVSDIEKAFLNVAVYEEDRDAMRFLWLKDCSLPPTEENLEVYRFARIAFGLKPSPYLLSGSLEEHFERHPSSLTTEIKENLYVDNVLMHSDTIEEARPKCEKAIELFASASMPLREFNSNQIDAIGHLPSDRLDAKEATKFLGIGWNTHADELELTVPAPPESATLTKRALLAAIASAYDPMGLIAPTLLKARVAFQNLWKAEVGWDQPLPETIREQLKIQLNDWHPGRVTIPRRVISCPIKAAKAGLVAFSDASLLASSCNVYLRLIHGQTITSHLVLSKTKLAPIESKKKKGLSIHKLELLGIVIATRAVDFVKSQLSRALNLEPETIVWTDSSSSLGWLCNRKTKQEVFIENRLTEIREIPNLTVHYVASADNPADYGTKGKSPNELCNSSLWWHGPNWLCATEWPRSKTISSYHYETPTPNTEIPDEPAQTALSAQKLDPPLSDLTDQHSSFKRLVAVTARCLRFIQAVSKGKCKGKILGNLIHHLHSSHSLALSPRDWKVAQWCLLICAQCEFPPMDKEINNLGLFPDEVGLYRSEGRIYRSALELDAKRPIYLPASARLAKLLILDLHERLSHAAANITLAQLRRQFWIPQGRRRVAHAIRVMCQPCRTYSAQPFTWPKMPHLPSPRVTISVPFRHTGLDCFGPMKVKVGGAVAKAWGTIFTCLCTRAVHLEVVEDMSARAFLGALKRFMARRGVPLTVLSDNGTNFVASQKLLTKEWADGERRIEWALILSGPTIQEETAKAGIRWQFIAERSPWRGGLYEKLVDLTKRHLRSALGRKLYQIIELTTSLAEVEQVLNLRPITFASDDAANPTVLTPMHCLLPLNDRAAAYPLYGEPDLDPAEQVSDLVSAWETSKLVVQKFWDRWHEEYLLTLRERDRAVNQRHSVDRAPIVGELVLVFEDDLPRSQWRRGIIQAKHVSSDGTVRTLSIRLPNGNVLKRAINHVFPLELRGENDPINGETEAQFKDPIGTSPSNKEPIREQAGPTAMQLRSGKNVPRPIFKK